MYNNIGLATPRGSGTSGYVVSNRAKSRNFQSKLDFMKELKSLRENILKPERRANQEIVTHNTKRQVYVRLEEIRERLEHEGKSKDEIETILKKAETKLLEKLKQRGALNSAKNDKNSHQLALLKDKQLSKIKNAFEMGEGYEYGSAFDFEAQEKNRLEKIYNKELKKIEKVKERNRQKKLKKLEKKQRKLEAQKAEEEEEVKKSGSEEGEIQKKGSRKTEKRADNSRSKSPSKSKKRKDSSPELQKRDDQRRKRSSRKERKRRDPSSSSSASESSKSRSRSKDRRKSKKSHHREDRHRSSKRRYRRSRSD